LAIVLFIWPLLRKNKILDSLENLAYIIIALVPFPYLLSLFLIYLPFTVFGVLFTKKGFIQSYVIGFALSLIPTILIYTASNYFGLSLSFFSIALFYYLPVLVAFFVVVTKRKSLEFLNVDFKEVLIFITILASTIFVAINIVDNSSLFMSNGTYMYSKFELIVKSINPPSIFPIYDPATSSGESPFLFETPLVFSHPAFANGLLNFIPPVTFYNLYSLYILFLAALSLSVLLRSILNLVCEEEKHKLSYILVVILGSLSIGLNFYFVQHLEAFKAFFAFSINYLIFALILEKPRKLKEMALIFYMIVLTFITHTPHGFGIVLISFSLIFLILMKIYISKSSHIKGWLFKNKGKAIAIGIIIIFLPSFYIAPAWIFKDLLEEKGKLEWDNFYKALYTYPKPFFTSNGPLSLRYPDIRRNDDKKFGPFISIFGLFALIFLLIFNKSKSLGNLKLFSGAYALHFLISSIAINIPTVASLEYGYRTTFPYFLILLVMSICAFIILIKQKHLKWALIIIFSISFIYTMPLAKANIENIHRERLISGESFKQEIDIIKNLPNDGRIIDYGLFANAIDPGMASLTGKYFSRYHLTEMARERSIYSKIHGTHSFGQEKFVINKSGVELSNYLQLGGYKYVFLNICHPIGNFIISSIYPDFAYPIYQNPQNQCLAFLVVNGTNYAEKVSILKDVNEEVYKSTEGFKYFTISKYHDFGEDLPYSEKVIIPEALNFERKSPTEVNIYGDFNDDDWVVFKEDYFSRWKAYMEGKEIPVLANNHNSILIKSIKGDMITLKYSVLPIEKLFGSISFISALLLLIVFLIFLRK
jgi:hypothetical protein